MYVPEIFALKDPAETARVLREHSFGLLVTAPEGRIHSSHLPFLFEPESGRRGRLLGHMARANPQWKDFAALDESEGEALVVFQGEHGYISPSWYGEGPAVPTWNYLAVHAYGRPRIIDAPEDVRALLERLVAVHESGAARPWSMESQTDTYLQRMMRGIVAFELPIARLEAKAKLSQNKNAADRAGVMAALESSPRGDDRRLAAVMMANGQGG